jgi:hypothetical protein
MCKYSTAVPKAASFTASEQYQRWVMNYTAQYMQIVNMTFHLSLTHMRRRSELNVCVKINTSVAGYPAG